MLFRFFVIVMLVIVYFKVDTLCNKIDQMSIYTDQLGISIEKFMSKD